MGSACSGRSTLLPTSPGPGPARVLGLVSEQNVSFFPPSWVTCGRGRVPGTALGLHFLNCRMQGGGGESRVQGSLGCGN